MRIPNIWRSCPCIGWGVFLQDLGCSLFPRNLTGRIVTSSLAVQQMRDRQIFNQTFSPTGTFLSFYYITMYTDGGSPEIMIWSCLLGKVCIGIRISIFLPACQNTWPKSCISCHGRQYLCIVGADLRRVFIHFDKTHQHPNSGQP